MPIKSVHITNYYHKTSGGISTAYNKLLEAANRRERFVRLIVPGPDTTVEEVGEFGRIYYVKAGFSPLFDKRYRLMLPWSAYLLEGTPVKSILREEDPEIIEIGEKYTLSLMAGLVRKHILTVASKRPVLVHLSCERMDDNVRAFLSTGKLSKWFARRYMANYIVPMFDFHMANSDYTAGEFFDSVRRDAKPKPSDRILNFFWRYLRAAKLGLKERTFVNQCGVDNVTFAPTRKSDAAREAFAKDFGIPADDKWLLYAGRISPEKNTGLLLETMEQLSRQSDKFHLLVAGGGPSTGHFEKDASIRVPGKVVIAGHITDKERLADLFANCDVFVHPNPREPFGITPLEAMASGLPVVAPNSGGLLSYANESNSWLCEPNGAVFADAIKNLFEDEGSRNRKIAAGVSTAQKYDWDRSTDAIFDTYDRMYAAFMENTDLFDYAESAKDIDFAKTIANA